MGIWVTGDTHGDFKRFAELPLWGMENLTDKDFIVILGDFGAVWDWHGETDWEKDFLDYFERQPYTLLFIDGNHDNFDQLNAMPVSEWHGGKVHLVRPSVIHLMRGQIYEVDGAKIFAFGGARSHDIADGVLEPGDERIWEWREDYGRQYRVNHRTWWAEEMPSQEEMDEGLFNLKRCGNRVDFIFTHCAATSVGAVAAGSRFKPDALTDYLEKIRQTVSYEKWLFGHYHADRTLPGGKEILMYEDFLQIR